jgi:phosphoglycerol transferase
VLAVAVVSVAPTLIYQRVNGPNPGATLRSTFDVEVYSLQPAQLILPLENHRLAGFRAQAAAYRRLIRQLDPALNNESRLAWLGTLASLGFIFLLGLSLIRVRDPEDGPWAGYRLGDLASVNLAMLVLGTVWGVGFLIAFWVTSTLRGYNRVSVVIAMVALLALGAVVDRYCRKVESRKWVAFAAAFVLLAIGLFDQTSASFVPTYVRNKTAYNSQRAFGASAQKLLPAGAMVFQLPYTPFPGAGVELPAGYGDYDPLIPYIYSEGLKWSFGAMRGRELAAWQAKTAALPVPKMLELIKQKDFSAVYVDRLGYKDQGQRIVAELTATLGKPDVTSSNGRMLLWSIGK